MEIMRTHWKYFICQTPYPNYLFNVTYLRNWLYPPTFNEILHDSGGKNITAVSLTTRTLNYNVGGVVYSETTTAVFASCRKIHKHSIATAYNIVRETISTERVQQWRRRVASIIDSDAVDAAGWV